MPTAYGLGTSNKSKYNPSDNLFGGDHNYAGKTGSNFVALSDKNIYRFDRPHVSQLFTDTKVSTLDS